MLESSLRFTQTIRTGPMAMGLAACLMGCQLPIQAPGTKVDVSDVRVTKPFALTVQEVEAMLTRANPEACSALNDAGAAQILSVYQRLAVTLGKEVLEAGISDEALQAKLDEAKQLLRYISANTNWLPRKAERMIGNFFYKWNKLEEDEGPWRGPQKEMEARVREMFDVLHAYAKTVLKSDIDFVLRIVKRADMRAPFALGGGIVVVPSEMIVSLAGIENADQVIAFMLAHEFSHILRAHKSKMIQLTLVDGLAMAKEFKRMTRDAKVAAGGVKSLDQLFSFTEENVAPLMDQVCKVTTWKPSQEQDQEFEADVCGTMLIGHLSKATDRKFDPRKGFDAYAAMTKEDKGGQPQGAAAGDSEYLCPMVTSHPATEERQTRIAAYALSQGWVVPDLVIGRIPPLQQVALLTRPQPESKPQSPPAPPPPIETGSPVPRPARYAVQIGAFRVKESADAVSERVETQLKGGAQEPLRSTLKARVWSSLDKWFRVTMGDFDNLDQAREGMRRARALGFSDAFVRRVQGSELEGARGSSPVPAAAR